MTKDEVFRLYFEAMAAKQEWFIAWERYLVASRELHDSEIPTITDEERRNCIMATDLYPDLKCKHTPPCVEG